MQMLRKHVDARYTQNACWTARQYWGEINRATNDEQIKQPLIIHSHTVICIKLQANSKLFERNFRLFPIVGIVLKDKLRRMNKRITL